MSEAGLDYFGARYFSGAQGRWTSPDPVEVSGRHIANPQKWNKYVYVQNNPLTSIDPDGLDDYRVFAPDTRVRGNWQTSRRVAEANGHTFTPYLGNAATVKAFISAISDPNARVIYVGHTTRGDDGVNGIALSDGVAAGNVAERQKNGSSLEVISVEPKANTVCILACDSIELHSQYPNSDFVGVDSGKNHQTSLEAMTPAGQAFVAADAVARPANANPLPNPFDPVKRANDALKAKQRAEDLDGDRVVRP
jgi:RHS repeat-associated protein